MHILQSEDPSGSRLSAIADKTYFTSYSVSKVNKKKAFAAAKAEPTFRGTLLKKSIKMK